MNKRIRTAVASLAVVGAGAVGLSQVGGVVNAQADEEPADTTSQEQPVDEPTDGDETDTTDERRGRGHHRRGGAEKLEALVELLGVEAEDLRTQLRDGTPLAEIAAANGVDAADVVDLIVDARQNRLDTAVENGRLTQEQADTRAADLEERVATRVEEGRPERDGEGRRGRMDRGAEQDATASDTAETATTDE